MKQPEVWGIGSLVAFLIIVAILVFGPFFMGPVSPPGYLLLLVFPVVIAALIIFLIICSK
ncbi:transmembrane protein, putative [Medicago truncatula]|uniref:Transmembrane protein, putative n=1 Tax=Medicago truncatula TaxID=3880 RepID=G7IQ06_MEDTR|nr:transmembrane protein, putative [Medicago truncatula]